jgi:hypothetical protein
MIIPKGGLPFIAEYIENLNEGIKQLKGHGLSRAQLWWFRFVLLAMLVTNSLCWARFERFSLGGYTAAAFGWLFRRAKIPWEILLLASTRHLIRKYGICKGSLVVDDTDNDRSKCTKRIAMVHKVNHYAAEAGSLNICLQSRRIAEALSVLIS